VQEFQEVLESDAVFFVAWLSEQFDDCFSFMGIVWSVS
jgi:hypothetical protein